MGRAGRRHRAEKDHGANGTANPVEDDIKSPTFESDSGASPKKAEESSQWAATTASSLPPPWLLSANVEFDHHDQFFYGCSPNLVLRALLIVTGLALAIGWNVPDLI
jgi:hypothetical protein